MECLEIYLLSLIFQVILADEEKRKLIFSEKEAAWLKFSKQINIGDIFEAMVGSVEDYGAFVHLRFPDGTSFSVTYITGNMMCFIYLKKFNGLLKL